jgi:hypothetical protein
MSQAPFVVQPRLSAIALAYRNVRFIADSVLPRVFVDSPTFKYSTFTKEDAFTVPDTKVGPKSRVNEIDWTATESTAQTQDYALEDAVPYFDVQAAQAARTQGGVNPIDPEARSTELITDLISLDRENRVAALVFNLASYATANKTTLAGVTQWSDTTSDPVTAILTAFDGMLTRPNIGVFGRAVYTKLRMHPKVTAAVFSQGGNAAQGGVVSRQAIADLLELDQVLVGESFLNTAKKGQTATYGQVWGKHAAFLYQNPQVQGPQGGITFGVTAQWGQRIAGTIGSDSSIGMRGGTRVRVGEAVKELVLASDAGYFFQNAVA